MKSKIIFRHVEEKGKSNNSAHINTKRIKYLEIYLAKEVKDLYNEIYIPLQKSLTRMLEIGKTSPVFR